MGKPLVQSKEFWFNFVMFFLAVLALPELVAILPAFLIPYVALVTAIGNTLLRYYFTSQPITGVFK